MANVETKTVDGGEKRSSGSAARDGATTHFGAGAQQAAIGRIQKARAYNATRVEQVKEFDRLTNGVASRGVRAIMSWQHAHGLPYSGKVDDATLAAARQAGADVSFGDDEVDEIEGCSEKQSSFEGAGNALASQAVAQGQTSGQEKRTEKPGQQAKWAADSMPEAIGTTAENFDFVEEAGLKGEVGVKGLGFAVQVPRLVDLLREHKYGEAAKLVADAATSWGERAELLRLALQKAGLKLAPWVFRSLETVAKFGIVIDVLAIGYEWTMAGFEGIREAHEKGDQDSRIGVYAFAWSDSCLNGSHSNPGAVGAELQEAKERGIADGLATRAKYPELPDMLLAQYGGNKMNARLALQDALYESAGYKGVRQHHEP
jgi:hypothetical protein